MRLSKLLKNIRGIKELLGNMETEITCLSADSRSVMENGLFFCLTGGAVDSHVYAMQAIKNGAVAIVTERRLETDAPQIVVEDSREAISLISAAFYGDPSERMRVVGITGTNGKTTVSYMLASILENAGKKTGIIGTLGIRYGNKKINSGLTTPDPIQLQKVLAEMFLHGVEYVVMEVSAHALWYKKTDGISFAACIFTNLSQDHLDFFRDMQQYKETKLRLFSKDCPIAIVNGDEETGREIGKCREAKEVASMQKTVFYGLQTPADAFAVVTDESLYKTECVLNINDRLCRLSLSMTGRHNVYNALAAAACAVELGVSTQSVSEGLKLLKGVDGRLENVGCCNGADIYVDFAHTPDGLAKSLDALRPHCKGRLLCLFGCGGNRDKTKRPLMGEIAAKKADFSVLTSDNPRYEDPLDIIAGIEKGYRRFSIKYVVVPDRKTAIGYALELLRENDILLIAGKGGEEYQEIMGIKYRFKDHDIIEKLLKKKECPRSFKE